MNTLLYNTVIFILIILSGILLLSITLSNTDTDGFKKADIDPVDANERINMNTKMDNQTIDVDYIYFKTYTMNEIEKKNQTILQIKEEINQTEIAIEEARLRRIHNSKLQNTQLNAGLNTYQIKSNGWQSFKSNFTTNFKRMGLPFSELFPKNAK